MKIMLTLLVNLCLITSLLGDTLVTQDYIYKESIRTVNFYLAGNAVGHPVMALYSADQLELHFDDMGDEVKDYRYTVVQCNADWTVGSLNEMEYIDGFTEGNILDYDYAYNVKRDYVHYRLRLPDQDMNITKSGNYLLMVYEDGDRENLVLTRRFYMVDPKVKVLARMKRSGQARYYMTHQEVQFDIEHKDLDIGNAFQEVYVTVMQNMRADNAYYGVQPVFIKDRLIQYRREAYVIFPGMKEFHYADFRDLHLKNDQVQSTNAAFNEVLLKPDEMRTFKGYQYWLDANGKFITGVGGMFVPRDMDVESDYMDVKFRLMTGNDYPSGDIYIFGGLTNWQLDERFKMNFNYETRAYEQEVNLKQGLYNYCYAYVKKGTNKPDTSILDGDWHETENSYQVLVYYKPIGGRYDQLIAFKELNTLNPGR